MKVNQHVFILCFALLIIKKYKCEQPKQSANIAGRRKLLKKTYLTYCSNFVFHLLEFSVLLEIHPLNFTFLSFFRSPSFLYVYILYLRRHFFLGFVTFIVFRLSQNNNSFDSINLKKAKTKFSDRNSVLVDVCLLH